MQIRIQTSANKGNKTFFVDNKKIDNNPETH